MAQEIQMPKLSDTMTEGTVSKWYKKVGDAIKEGDIVADIETDKATQEFESEYTGTLLYVGAKEGEAIGVNELIAIIGNEKEEISHLISAQKKEEIQEVSQKTQIEEVKSTEVPSGVEIIAMPRLSDTMTEGKVQKWYKKAGDEIKEGDILADIETDKAIQEFESEFSGTLLHIGAKEGESIEVEKILAIVGPSGVDISDLINHKTPNKPKIENQLKEPELEIKQKNDEIKSDRIFISPLAKKMASEKGIDLNEITGSGDGGRIVAKDIENIITQIKTPQFFATSQIQNFENTFLPIGSIKKVAAKRLCESKFTAPHYYLTMEFDMEQIIQMREEINKTLAPNKVSFNDILIKFVAIAIKKHPQVNVSWAEDKIIQHNNIHIGVAVAIDEGLLVPVINHADQKSFEAISAEVKDKAKRSRERKIKAEELIGSTFSISNLGSYGIESFTSIINQPNACILSVGAIVQKPVVKNNQIVVGNTMKVTLACDHRTVDGATGSAFLQTLKRYIETPVLLLL
jgi:pyruvate dehydrogenase E2 component (dihydrolipoamide acetyltransferase)